MTRIFRSALLLASATLTLAAGPATNWNTVTTRTAQASHVLGNPAAKVKLTTFVSYTCPACARFEGEANAALKLQYIRSGKVSVEIRHVVRDPIDLTVALLTHCGAKKKFAFNHSAFMRSRQSGWPLRGVPPKRSRRAGPMAILARVGGRSPAISASTKSWRHAGTTGSRLIAV